ncbi:MAG: hypothetical protein QOK43_1926 [Acidimicrobiaceae bacterium]|nr:hypothetical protein [Acidimicrobiaceae bacterium]
MAGDEASVGGGRVLYAGLSLLDRQMVDRNDKACGKVDDLELSYSGDTGTLYVSALLAGPGMLAYRLRRRRWGLWWQRVNRAMWPGRGLEAGAGAGEVAAGEVARRDGEADLLDDPARVPMSLVAGIDNHVTLGTDRDRLATMSLERWAREHITSHVPGGAHEAE